MRIKDLIREGWDLVGDAETAVHGVRYDSRKVRDGDLFVAIRGEASDGHNFIHEAITRGACGVVYDRAGGAVHALLEEHPGLVWVGVDDSRAALAALSSTFYGDPSKEVTVVGITGTNGKTTTSYLMKSILEEWGEDAGVIGTINYVIRDSVYDAPHTTPESPEFQSLLREMADRGCTYVITEVSSHALAQKRIDGTHIKVAVFSNLTRDHLDFHGSMEEYFESKLRLFTEILEEDGVAVINEDDPYGQRLVKMLRGEGAAAEEAEVPPVIGGLPRRGVKIMTYSVQGKGADIAASEIKTTMKGTSFRLRFSLNKGTVEDRIISPLIGIANVYNVLAAIGASVALGIPLKAIKGGIEKRGVVKGRFEKVDLGQQFLAVVDYAHTEDALERLLRTMRQVLRSTSPGGNIITIFGCGGNRDRGKRPKMGEIATALSDFVIITSDNPRREDPREIIRDIEKGVEKDNYVVIPDRNAAIITGVALASAGDGVVVAGKGHEEYQEVRGKRFPFSDRACLEQAIRSLTAKPAAGDGFRPGRYQPLPSGDDAQPRGK